MHQVATSSLSSGATFIIGRVIKIFLPDNSKKLLLHLGGNCLTFTFQEAMSY